MSWYYFDLHNGDGRFIDEDGSELKSREEATKQASHILLDVARDEIPEIGRGIASIRIRDSTNKPIGLISLTFMAEWFDEDEAETTKSNR